ncbi:MAG: LamG domain-containing protein, partial [bacterium]|nr:LamG domain-containing protein [bacterium]
LPLISNTVITDGDWHRVGFVRDGTDRILYVDDIEVARDSVEVLERAKGDIYIGAGRELEYGSFWSGLIDDVRIYDRVVEP